MKTTLPLLLILCIIIAVPASAAKLTSTMVVHDIEQIYQAYPGYSSSTSTGALDRGFAGYEDQTETPDNITAVPGILQIIPGDLSWSNYVAAAQPDGTSYTIKNVTFQKNTPAYTQCGLDQNGNPIFPAHTVTQQGTSNIRLWWPLMYEVPSTTFTLTILYGTGALFQDDPINPPAWAHVEQWIWHVDADFESLANLLALFHELPFGKDEVPLISDETLYEELQLKIAAAEAAHIAADKATAAAIHAEFELEVMDACISVSPSFPNQNGTGTGIANTTENPACCKLLVDTEYILMSGIGIQKK